VSWIAERNDAFFVVQRVLRWIPPGFAHRNGMPRRCAELPRPPARNRVR